MSYITANLYCICVSACFAKVNAVQICGNVRSTQYITNVQVTNVRVTNVRVTDVLFTNVRQPYIIPAAAVDCPSFQTSWRKSLPAGCWTAARFRQEPAHSSCGVMGSRDPGVVIVCDFTCLINCITLRPL